MAGKPSIAIVGAGNLGTALALALRRKGYRIEAVVVPGRKKSLRRARSLAKQVRSRVATSLNDVHADVVWLCVPDGEIPRVAEMLAERFIGRDSIALHSSGALSSDALVAFRQKGAAVASAHPFMTFVRGSHASLAGVPFAIEGDAAAVRLARRIVRDLGAESYPIRKSDKAAYHTWGTFASPLLTALLVTTERVAGIAGVKRAAARRRMMPILLRTLVNYASLGPEQAFSGPIIRGDVETIQRHLNVLRGSAIPHDVYLALARAALHYLPAKNKTALKRLLDSHGN